MIFSVSHFCFQTDRLGWTTTLVEAETKEEALEKYNKVAEARKEYPYCWDKRTIRSVHEPEILR